MACTHPTAMIKKRCELFESMKSIMVFAFCAGIFLFGSLTLQAQQDSTAGQVPDNTKINQRDRDPSVPTADQQKDNAGDRKLTQQIRKSLMQDKSLSMYAHNIKIISQGGMVTLKGPVRSEDEKQAIEAKAKEVAGADKVSSELQVAPKP
jgi:hyperosmotically inducible periplasmic protein